MEAVKPGDVICAPISEMLASAGFCDLVVVMQHVTCKTHLRALGKSQNSPFYLDAENLNYSLTILRSQKKKNPKSKV